MRRRATWIVLGSRRQHGPPTNHPRQRGPGGAVVVKRIGPRRRGPDAPCRVGRRGGLGRLTGGEAGPVGGVGERSVASIERRLPTGRDACGNAKVPAAIHHSNTS